MSDILDEILEKLFGHGAEVPSNPHDLRVKYMKDAAEEIRAHFISKDKVRKALGEDENVVGVQGAEHIKRVIRNDLRQSVKKELEL